MKRFVKAIALAAVAVILTTTGVALAAEFKSPVEILSDISGQPVEDLRDKRLEGEPYGAIAQDYGKLDQFRDQMIEQKKAILQQRVEDGHLTPEQAEEIESSLGTVCDGEGGGSCGQGYGIGFGRDFSGRKDGQGRGLGRGHGMRCGR